MTPAEERAYLQGQRSVWVTILRQALGELAYHDAPDLLGVRLATEREEAIMVLRRLCRDYGDNEWPDNLHLADVIDKHLGRHLG